MVPIGDHTRLLSAEILTASNFNIPVNRPRVPVHSYSKDGVMRVENVSDPVYAPNSKGGPAADPGTLSLRGEVGG